MYCIVTNNPLVQERYQDVSKDVRVLFVEAENCLKVLESARNEMHKGMRLETHPMAGSVKPNQNPYKSVVVSNGKNTEEEAKDQLLVIENAIINSRDFLQKRPLPNWDAKLLEDFKFVDLSLIESGINNVI